MYMSELECIIYSPRKEAVPLLQPFPAEENLMTSISILYRQYNPTHI